MKKIRALVLIIVMAMFTVVPMTGCTGLGTGNATAEDIIGTWTLTQITDGTTTVAPGHAHWTAWQGSITFNSDFTFEDLHGPDRDTGTWEMTSVGTLRMTYVTSTQGYTGSHNWRADVDGNTFEKSHMVGGIFGFFGTIETWSYTRAV